MGQIIPYYTKWVHNIVEVLTFWELQPFPEYFVITKIPNMSNLINILAYINQYSARKIMKGSMRQRYPYTTRWVKNIVVIPIIYGFKVVILIFYYHQDTEYEKYEIEMSAFQRIFAEEK